VIVGDKILQPVANVKNLGSVSSNGQLQEEGKAIQL